MEIIINFNNGKQVITDSWVKAENYYNLVRKDITTIFIGDEIVYNWSTGLDTFSSVAPPAVKKVGIKHNSKKPKMSLLFKQFPKALEAIVRCSEYGNEKYKETDHDFMNFKRVEGGSQTYADAGIRHRMSNGNDEESGLPHAYHIAWNALAELELYIQENEDNQNSNK